jgi:hypothetical protein
MFYDEMVHKVHDKRVTMILGGDIAKSMGAWTNLHLTEATLQHVDESAERQIEAIVKDKPSQLR